MKMHIPFVVVILCMLALHSAAWAQYRVGDDGRALDANNQIGSGGYNTGRPRGGPTQDQIFYGNVTGGVQFRGNINSHDPFAFRGHNVGSAGMDRFVRDSAGAPINGQTQNVQRNPQAFYAQSRLAPPPPQALSGGQYVLNPQTGAYVPAPPPDRRLMTGDTRLGRPMGDPLPPLPMPGELMLPGPVDPSQTGGVLTASPLYGLREWRSGERELMDTTGPKGPVEIAAIERMRSELLTTSALDENGKPIDDSTTENPLTGPMLNQSMAIQAPMESPRPIQLTTDPLEAVLGKKKLQPKPGDVSTEQSLRQRLLAPPERQSSQYAEMRRRYSQFQGQKPQTDQEANADFQRDMRARQAQEQAKGALLKEPVAPGATANKSGDQTSGVPGVPDLGKQNQELAAKAEKNAGTGVPRPEPMHISSLAEGVKAKGLNELLASAEALAKQGKYTSAVAQYERAEHVAPNNPLIWIGRANAELGAGFFLRAEQNLRYAFKSDPTLLVGKYDLKTFLGDERVKELVKDLSELADDEPTQTRPLFLLAWIAYNTGEERKAAAYLDLAEKRSNGRDDVYKVLRDNWTLPKEENK